MKYARHRVLFAVLVLIPVQCLRAGNAVVYWDEEAIDASRLSRNPPPLAALHFATFHAAIFDAVNGLELKRHGWCTDEKAPVGADPDAAIAGAACTVLQALWGQSSNPRGIDAAYQRALAGIADGPAKIAGLAWGGRVAQAVLARRAASGYSKVLAGDFTSPEPGKWRETPPGFRPPVTPQMGMVIPFVMTTPDQFRAPPPKKLDSKEMADEIAYVARVGGRDGAERTEYETLSTPFWSDDLGTGTPAGHWNMVAQELAERFKLSEIETARLFALMDFAMADGGISCWETKFTYRTWRPETAIREIDAKTNPYAKANPDFIPNMVSPAHPDYTSGHSTFSGAATRLLALYFGRDDITFSVASDGLPGVVRTYHSFSEARREVGMSRVWAGIHLMSSNLEGQKAGIKIADWVYAHALLPRN